MKLDTFHIASTNERKIRHFATLATVLACVSISSVGGARERTRDEIDSADRITDDSTAEPAAEPTAEDNIAIEQARDELQWIPDVLVGPSVALPEEVLRVRLCLPLKIKCIEGNKGSTLTCAQLINDWGAGPLLEKYKISCTDID